jgi:putative transposase
VCRKIGISEATFFNWKRKFSGLGTAELRRLRQLEDENFRLKQVGLRGCLVIKLTGV